VTDYADFTGRTRGRFCRAAGACLGLPGQGELQGGALVKGGRRAFRDRPAHVPRRLGQAEGNLGALEARLCGRKPTSRGRTPCWEEARFLERVRQSHRRTAAKRAHPARALKAAVERAKLDLDLHPGHRARRRRVSRYVVTVGNLVQAGDQGGGTPCSRPSCPSIRCTPISTWTRTPHYEFAAGPRGQGRLAPRRRLPVSLGWPRAGHRTGDHRLVDNQVNRRPAPSGCGACSPTRSRSSSPAVRPRRTPIGRPTRPCW